jgi:hypothetical protein
MTSTWSALTEKERRYGEPVETVVATEVAGRRAIDVRPFVQAAGQ